MTFNAEGAPRGARFKAPGCWGGAGHAHPRRGPANRRQHRQTAGAAEAAAILADPLQCRGMALFRLPRDLAVTAQQQSLRISDAPLTAIKVNRGQSTLPKAGTVAASVLPSLIHAGFL